MAAAQARAGKKRAHHSLPPSSYPSLPEVNRDSASPPLATNLTDHVLIFLESESDCGYTGGINCYISDTESDDEWIDSGSGDSDGSISEFCGEELEENLRELQEEAKALHLPTPYALIMSNKSKKDWREQSKIGHWGM
jgi:hypothetical protein